MNWARAGNGRGPFPCGWPIERAPVLRPMLIPLRASVAAKVTRRLPISNW
jgi:hypothetical protein